MNPNLNATQFSREALRDEIRLAQHAQTLRAENQAMGYKSETAGFYGSDRVAPAEHSERRLTLADADREHAARTAADREGYENHVPMSDDERTATFLDLKAAGW